MLETVGSAVRALREAHALTQAELAAQFSALSAERWHPSTVAKVEGGSRALTFVEAGTLAEVFGVTLDEFFAAAQSDDARRAAQWLASLNLAQADFSRLAESLSEAVDRIGAARQHTDAPLMETTTAWAAALRLDLDAILTIEGPDRG